uniref:Uncharacterized protein n=1 Tax=Plectus sambesii TaxID=2011161 RepID=A0A914VPC0_9BILA
MDTNHIGAISWRGVGGEQLEVPSGGDAFFRPSSDWSRASRRPCSPRHCRCFYARICRGPWAVGRLRLSKRIRRSVGSVLRAVAATRLALRRRQLESAAGALWRFPVCTRDVTETAFAGQAERDRDTIRRRRPPSISNSHRAAAFFVVERLANLSAA